MFAPRAKRRETNWYQSINLVGVRSIGKTDEGEGEGRGTADEGRRTTGGGRRAAGGGNAVILSEAKDLLFTVESRSFGCASG
jgi:hypothetical protein